VAPGLQVRAYDVTDEVVLGLPGGDLGRAHAARAPNLRAATRTRVAAAPVCQKWCRPPSRPTPVGVGDAAAGVSGGAAEQALQPTARSCPSARCQAGFKSLA
jgi:hypothetical protein